MAKLLFSVTAETAYVKPTHFPYNTGYKVSNVRMMLKD